MTQFKVDFNDFKRRDNTNLMEITLYKDNGEQITPNRDHQWSGKALKFGDGDKRLDQELAVTIDGDKIGVPSKQLENLPSGDYGLELWEVSNDSKTIYPSAGFVEFHIHRNADESLESVTPTIDIDKVIDDLHQAGLNVVVDGIEMLAPDATPSVTSEIRDGKNHIKLHVPRGLKGDIGPAPTLKIGTVTKLNPDQAPTVNISGDNGAYTLDLGIPQGSKGDPGNNGFYHYMVDLTDAKFDRNKWYYVKTNSHNLGSLGGPSYFSLDAPLDSVPVPYGTHSGSGVCARQTVLYGQSYWGAYPTHKLIVLDDEENFVTDSKRLLTFAIPSDYNLDYGFYARGGLKINVTSDIPGLTLTSYTDTLVVNYTTIPVLNDAPDPKALGFDDYSTFWALPMSQLREYLSNESVHKTGNETIAGDKALVGNTTLATTKILAGNYGLRVTSSGFEKTTDGITWVPANI